MSYDISEREYGGSIFKGSEWTDTVCITTNQCVENFEFFIAEEQSGFTEPIDGIMGLARYNNFYLGDEKKTIVGPLYLLALYTEGLINEPTFSFATSQIGGLSYIDFGAPQDSSMRKPSDLVYFDLLEDFFWSMNC